MYSSAKTASKTSPYLVRLIADYESDIDTLPVRYTPGSTCRVVESGKVYMLNNQEQWIEQPSGGGSGGGTGGGTGSLEGSLATKPDIDNLFDD